MFWINEDHPEDALDVEEVLRYFVVHNFLVNGDSYTGTIVHNYYLHEKDGKLSMIPWDYNLAYGTFSGGNASSSVNSPIDTPVSGGMSDRPMVAWIFNSEEYAEQYHALFAEFLETFDLEAMIDETAALIAPYVKKDPTAFCTYEEFETGVETLKSFCTLREESVKGQLDGTIPSIQAGQSADSSSLIDTTGLNLSAMGSMGGSDGGFGGGFGGNSFSGGRSSKDGAAGESAGENADSGSATPRPSTQPSAGASDTSGGNTPNTGGNGNTPPSGFGGGNMPEGFSGSMPEGFDAGSLPEGFDASSLPSSLQPGSTENGGDTGSSGEASSSEGSGRSGSGRGGFSGRGGADGGFDFSGGSFPGGSGSSGGGTANTVILLAVSAVVLLVGLLVAWKFKR